ncbi:MAG: glycosyltransferase family 39 protein [Planctomycetes bacterium]|nr:glycosyltransferase family 39 protein [Planctomycetota bacterium]
MTSATQPQSTPRTSGLAAKLAALFVLVVLPFFLRAAPVEHGLPRNYVPDTHMVRSALGMAKEKDLVPPVNRYSTYPNLLPYLLLPCYAAQYALGRATGEWKGSGEYGEHLLDHPEDAQVIGRWLVVLFGALTPLVVFKATRAAGLGRGAWIAAFLVATCLLHVQFSTQERPWVPLVFFMALAAWPAALYAESGRAKHLALSSVAAGLSFACHQGGVPAIGIPALAWLFGPIGWRGDALAQRARQIGLVALVFVVVSVPIGHPYWLRYGLTPPEAAVGGELAAQKGGLSIGGLGFIPEMRLDSVTRLSGAFFGYDPVIVLLGLAGFTLAWKEKRARPLMLFALLWAAVFLPQQSDHVRYLLPLAVFLAWPAGMLAERWLERRPSAIALGALLVFPLAQSLRFDHVLGSRDVRFDAEAKLAELPPGAVVAIDRFGPDVPLSRAALERLERLRGSGAKSAVEGASTGDALRSRERRRLELLKAGVATDAGPGLDALDVEELLDVDRDGRVCVKKAFASITTSPRELVLHFGATHVLLVNRRPGVGAPIARELVDAGARPVWSVDPSASAEHPTPECFLPVEMDFPLVGLWTVNRPGPWMALYALK